MKKNFLPVILVLFLPLFMAAQDKLPNRYEVLTQNYQRAIERANKPITQTYISQLKLLKNEMTQKGDLKQALQIEEQLKELGAIEKTLRDYLVGEKWLYSTGRSSSRMVFNSNGTRGDGGPWKLDDELTLTITYGDGNTCTFKFPDLETLSAEGRTKRGNERRTLKVIE